MRYVYIVLLRLLGGVPVEIWARPPGYARQRARRYARLVLLAALFTAAWMAVGALCGWMVILWEAQ